jgi:hypothetical protein
MLYKTTIVIWSEYPGDSVELSDLAHNAEQEDAYCSKMESKAVDSPKLDPDWDGTEFFDIDLT